MPAASLKDYYTILEISSASTQAEVKKAFRKLALKYHPDTGGGDIHNETNFREIKEAYNVLGNEASRRAYDEERWLSGMRIRSKEAEQITPEWLLKEVINLNKHMTTVDVYRMSHHALKEYVFQLLNDKHIEVLNNKKEASVNESIVKMIVQSTKGLKYKYMLPIADRLRLIDIDNDEVYLFISYALKERQRQAVWEKWLPYVIVITTLAIVIAMYFWASI